MKIYVGHLRKSDFKKELYEPIRNSKLNKRHTIMLPHEKSDESFSSKDFFKNKCDLMIAEVSNHSLGLGIELGWASLYNVKIICIYKKGSKLSNSLKTITDKFIEYINEDDMIQKLEKAVL